MNLKISRNGWGATIIDAMSTAILMDLGDVVIQALEFVPTIDFSKTNTVVNLFETTVSSNSKSSCLCVSLVGGKLITCRVLPSDSVSWRLDLSA